MSCPVTIDANTMPSMSGMSKAPELDAVRPCTICMNSGRNMIEPNMPTPDRNSTVMLAENPRSREEPDVEDRLGGVQLAVDEGGERECGEHEQADDGRRTPRVHGAAPVQGEQQRHEARGERGGAPPVDAVLLAVLRLGHRNHQHGQREHADRQVDVEDPAPAGGIGQPPSQRRAENRRQAEHRAHESLVASTLARLEQVADDRHAVRHHHAATDALDASEDDELQHRVGRTERR